MPRAAIVLALMLASSSTAGVRAADTLSPWPPEIRAQLSEVFLACLARAHAVRPFQQCYAAELTGQRAALDRAVAVRITQAATPSDADTLRRDQDAWSHATDVRCAPPAHQRGSLASQKAQACFLDAVVRRRMALTSTPAPAP